MKQLFFIFIFPWWAGAVRRVKVRLRLQEWGMRTKPTAEPKPTQGGNDSANRSRPSDWHMSRFIGC